MYKCTISVVFKLSTLYAIQGIYCEIFQVHITLNQLFPLPQGCQMYSNFKPNLS